MVSVTVRRNTTSLTISGNLTGGLEIAQYLIT